VKKYYLRRKTPTKTTHVEYVPTYKRWCGVYSNGVMIFEGTEDACARVVNNIIDSHSPMHPKNSLKIKRKKYQGESYVKSTNINRY